MPGIPAHTNLLTSRPPTADCFCRDCDDIPPEPGCGVIPSWRLPDRVELVMPDTLNFRWIDTCHDPDGRHDAIFLEDWRKCVVAGQAEPFILEGCPEDNSQPPPTSAFTPRPLYWCPTRWADGPDNPDGYSDPWDWTARSAVGRYNPSHYDGSDLISLYQLWGSGAVGSFMRFRAFRYDIADNPCAFQPVVRLGIVAIKRGLFEHVYPFQPAENNVPSPPLPIGTSAPACLDGTPPGPGPQPTTYAEPFGVDEYVFVQYQQVTCWGAGIVPGQPSYRVPKQMRFWRWKIAGVGAIDDEMEWWLSTAIGIPGWFFTGQWYVHDAWMFPATDPLLPGGGYGGCGDYSIDPAVWNSNFMNAQVGPLNDYHPRLHPDCGDLAQGALVDVVGGPDYRLQGLVPWITGCETEADTTGGGKDNHSYSGFTCFPSELPATPNDGQQIFYLSRLEPDDPAVECNFNLVDQFPGGSCGYSCSVTNSTPGDFADAFPFRIAFRPPSTLDISNICGPCHNLISGVTIGNGDISDGQFLAKFPTELPIYLEAQCPLAASDTIASRPFIMSAASGASFIDTAWVIQIPYKVRPPDGCPSESGARVTGWMGYIPIWHDRSVTPVVYAFTMLQFTARTRVGSTFGNLGFYSINLGPRVILPVTGSNDLRDAPSPWRMGEVVDPDSGQMWVPDWRFDTFYTNRMTFDGGGQVDPAICSSSFALSTWIASLPFDNNICGSDQLEAICTCMFPQPFPTSWNNWCPVNNFGYAMSVEPTLEIEPFDTCETSTTQDLWIYCDPDFTGCV